MQAPFEGNFGQARNPGSVAGGYQNYRKYMDDEMYGPLIEGLKSRMENMDLINPARERATKNAELSKAQSDRNASRYATNFSNAQKDYMSDKRAMGDTLSFGHAGNTARIQQDSAKQGLRSGLISYGDAKLSQGQQMSEQGAAMQSQRELDYENAKSAYKTNRMKNIVKGVATAGMIAAMFI